MSTSKNISNLIINKVESQTVYDSMKNRDLLNDDELYLILGDANIDASSINGLDTYLTNEPCSAKIVCGSYIGEGTRTNFTSLENLISNGRQIQLPFEPVKMVINNDTVLRQNNYVTKGVVTGTYQNPVSITYYVAHLKGSILYVASYAYYSTNDPKGYNSNETYNWKIIQ